MKLSNKVTRQDIEAMLETKRHQKIMLKVKKERLVFQPRERRGFSKRINYLK